MELVYLWVEDYKNIQRQGFNFSSKFNCHYDEVTKELTINKNDDYIPNFFGKNINVTAVIGKNGSGKSSVLNFVRLFLEENYKIGEKAILIFHDGVMFHSFGLSNDVNNLLNETDNTFFNVKYQNEDIVSRNYNNNSLDKDFLSKLIFPLFDYSLTYEKSDSGRRRRKLESFIPTGIEKNNENKIEVEKKLVKIFPKFPQKDGNSLDFFREDMDNLTKVLANYKVMENKEVFKDFFIPDRLILTIAKSKIRDKYKKVSQKTTLGEEETLVNEIEKIVSKELIGKDKTISEETFLLFHTMNKYFYDKGLLDDYSSEIKEDLLKKLYTKGVCKIKILSELIGAYQHDIMEFNISKLEENEIKYLLELAKTDMFKVSLIDEKNKNLEDLSFGEQQLLKILNIVYYLANNNKNIIFFFDEIDIGLHPEWQKKIFKYIIDILLQFPEKNFHLIMSSHSPFLLSDIPKGNVLLINGNLKKKQTFGANIHTLLSDSFFMEDGLMGEFAKNKIQEIMNFLNDKKTIEEISTKEEQIKQVIESIGEPFLKQKLLEMYYKKFKDEASKKARKDELLAEQKRIAIELKKYD